MASWYWTRTPRSLSLSAIDQLSLAHDEVILALKARRRTISVQPWSSFIAMEKDTDFRYRILLGDAESIRAELKGMNMEQSKQGKRSAAMMSRVH